MQISLQLANIANQSSPLQLGEASGAQVGSGGPPSSPQPYRFVAILWFTALVCGLSAASIAMSVNQWINNMLTPTALARSGSGPCEQLRIWNLRHETFRKWRLAIIIEIPSLLLQIALVLFLTGLVGYLWQLDSQVAIPTLALVALLLLFQFIVSVAPLFVSYSPFTSLQSRTLLWIVTPLVIKPAYWIGERVCFWLWYHIDNFQAVENLLFRTRSFYSDRLEDIVAAQSYVHNSWAQEESAFLRSKEGLAIDNSIMANSLSLIHDHSILRPIIEICQHKMLPEQSFANLVTMYKRMPPILSDDVRTPPWATDPETVGIYNRLHADVVKHIKKKFGDHHREGVRVEIDYDKEAPDYNLSRWTTLWEFIAKQPWKGNLELSKCICSYSTCCLLVSSCETILHRKFSNLSGVMTITSSSAPRLVSFEYPLCHKARCHVTQHMFSLCIDFERAKKIRDGMYADWATSEDHIMVVFTFTALMLKVTGRIETTSPGDCNGAMKVALRAFNTYMIGLAESGVTETQFWKAIQNCPAFAVQYFWQELQPQLLKKMGEVMGSLSCQR